MTTLDWLRKNTAGALTFALDPDLPDAAREEILAHVRILLELAEADVELRDAEESLRLAAARFDASVCDRLGTREPLWHARQDARQRHLAARRRQIAALAKVTT